MRAGAADHSYDVDGSASVAVDDDEYGDDAAQHSARAIKAPVFPRAGRTAPPPAPTARASAPRGAAESVTAAVLAYTALRARDACSCQLLKSLKVAQLRLLCAHDDVNVAISARDESGKKKLHKKPALMRILCPVCETEVQVAAASVSVVDREGIEARYWAPQLDPGIERRGRVPSLSAQHPHGHACRQPFAL